MIPKYRVEVIDDEVVKQKTLALYIFKKKNFFSKPDYHWHYSHQTGYNYRNHYLKSKEDIDKDFEDELMQMIEDYNIVEVKYITIKDPKTLFKDDE